MCTGIPTHVLQFIWNNLLEGEWEIKADGSGEDGMLRIRWSEPTKKGQYFYCRHYPATPWGHSAITSELRKMHEKGDLPWDFLHVTRTEWE